MFQHYIYTHAHPTHACAYALWCVSTHTTKHAIVFSLPLLHIHTHHTALHMHTFTAHTHTHTHTKCLYKVARKQYCPGLCNSKLLTFNLVVLLCYTLLKRPNKAETVLKRIMQYTSHLGCCYGNVHVILW